MAGEDLYKNKKKILLVKIEKNHEKSTNYIIIIILFYIFSVYLKLK